MNVDRITPEQLAAQPDLVRTAGATPPGGTSTIRIIDIPGLPRLRIAANRSLPLIPSG